MREYTLHTARTLDRAYLFPALSRLLRNFMARRSLLRLERLDDYILSDIGLTRDDLHYGARLPLDVDPIAELARIRRERMAKGLRKG
jgi:uncharacterized protein YjiS (DUF1127 family)